MRTYDIAHVSNGPYNPAFPAKSLMEMTFDEIKDKYIKNCGKANGNVSVCSRCETPCEYGKRAIQLIANQVYNDPPIPLYGGKTLIERAKEENMKRRAEAEAQKLKEEKKTIEEEKPKKKTRVTIEGWYESAMASEDPTAWIMDAFKCSKTKAKQKIYEWRFRHPEVKENDVFIKKKEGVKEVKTDTIKTEQKKEENIGPIVKIEPNKNDPIEKKLEALLKLQEQHKKAMEEYMKLYEEAKIEYEKIKEKTDILCSALDIVNEI